MTKKQWILAISIMLAIGAAATIVALFPDDEMSVEMRIQQ